MLMQIQLDHISKNFKISIKIALIIGLSILLYSCDLKEFKLVDSYVELSEYKTLSILNNEAINPFEKVLFEPLENYPNLILGVKLNNDDVIIDKMLLTSPNKDLAWDIDTQLLNIQDSKYFGASNINLASQNFEEGDYQLNIYSNDGRTISTTIYLQNKFNNLFEPYITLMNNSLYFTNTKESDLSNIKELKEKPNSGKFVVSFFNNEKNLLITKKFENEITSENYQFKIKIDNYEKVSYVKIYYNKDYGSQIEYNLDLSSAHSFL